MCFYPSAFLTAEVNIVLQNTSKITKTNNKRLAQTKVLQQKANKTTKTHKKTINYSTLSSKYGHFLIAS